MSENKNSWAADGKAAAGREGDRHGTPTNRAHYEYELGDKQDNPSDVKPDEKKPLSRMQDLSRAIHRTISKGKSTLSPPAQTTSLAAGALGPEDTVPERSMGRAQIQKAGPLSSLALGNFEYKTSQTNETAMLGAGRYAPANDGSMGSVGQPLLQENVPRIVSQQGVLGVIEGEPKHQGSISSAASKGKEAIYSPSIYDHGVWENHPGVGNTLPPFSPEARIPIGMRDNGGKQDAQVEKVVPEQVVPVSMVENLMRQLFAEQEMMLNRRFKELRLEIEQQLSTRSNIDTPLLQVVEDLAKKIDNLEANDRVIASMNSSFAGMHSSIDELKTDTREGLRSLTGVHNTLAGVYHQTGLVAQSMAGNQIAIERELATLQENSEDLATECHMQSQSTQNKLDIITSKVNKIVPGNDDQTVTTGDEPGSHSQDIQATNESGTPVVQTSNVLTPPDNLDSATASSAVPPLAPPNTPEHSRDTSDLTLDSLNEPLGGGSFISPDGISYHRPSFLNDDGDVIESDLEDDY